jgi:CheY-like chemotaxis protein
MPFPALSQNLRNRPLVLCVDDDSAILDITQAFLEKKGFSVITAKNWRDALDVVKNTPIDVVMLDYEMPGMKGHEVAALIRSINPDLPLILHSGAPVIPETAIKMTDAFIPKGTDWHILSAAISDLVEKSRVKRVPSVEIV